MLEFTCSPGLIEKDHWRTGQEDQPTRSEDRLAHRRGEGLLAQHLGVSGLPVQRHQDPLREDRASAD